MAHLVQCDVEGCDETVPVSDVRAIMLPPGWSNVVTMGSEIDAKRFSKKPRRPFDDMGFLPPDFPTSPFEMVVKKLCCPKHSMPRFKQLAPTGGDDQ